MSTIIAPNKRAVLEQLFHEFRRRYLQTADGRTQLSRYPVAREIARHNYSTILASFEQNRFSEQNRTIADEDLVEQILRELLPYADTATNRWRGAWIHPAPAISNNIKPWYEAAGWIQSDEWSIVTNAILHFIHECVEQPEQLEQTCQAFSQLGVTKGFQSAALSPILNALRPDEFSLVHNKSRKILNYFTQKKYSPSLTDYPAANVQLKTALTELSDLLRVRGFLRVQPADMFDFFSYWLVSIKRYSFQESRYWRIIIGDELWQWEEWQEGNFVALGWDELGDIAGIRKQEFDNRRNSLVAQLRDQSREWTKIAVNQVWRFGRQILEDDRVVVVRRSGAVLGMGTVVGSYYYVSEQPFGHRLPIAWDDTTMRTQNPIKGRLIVNKIAQEEFDDIVAAPPLSPPHTTVESGADSATGSILISDTLKITIPPFVDWIVPLLDALQKLGGVGKAVDVIQRIQVEKRASKGQIVANTSDETSPLRAPIYQARRFLIQAKLLESEQRGIWALTPAGMEMQLSDEDAVQLYQEVIYQHRITESLQSESPVIAQLAESMIPYEVNPDRANDSGKDGQAASETNADLLLSDEQKSRQTISKRDERREVDVEQHPVYLLSDVAANTYQDESILQRWVNSIERKQQAIFYGPPGTGKTYVAHELARHLVGGGDGFIEIVQFHAAYAYEDFVQGIRPQPQDNGSLSYPIVLGRFLEFCQRAKGVTGRCVMIIDEINRANLAQVFGELMHLLEYRTHSIRLAADGKLFQILSNVYLIGTMNTADRSIALVDHALRRRFAFIPLYPDYNVLRRYHIAVESGFAIEPLIALLQQLNSTIHDRHYEIGISFFLDQQLATNLADIWQMEIEPYLEELFFDRPERVEEFRWVNVRNLFDIEE